jgi:uncharacterized protein YlaN (UPF0358 family)
MADAQLQGTLGATSFVNMMQKLADPTREAKELLKAMNIQMTDAQGKWRPIVDIVMDIKKGLDQETDAAIRLGYAQEIFGIRGARGFSALAIAGADATKELQKQLESSLGASQEAAETRLDNILGSFVLFSSSLEGLAITLYTPFLDAGKKMVLDMTNGLNDVLLGIAELRRPLKEGETEFDRLREVAKKTGWEIVPVIQGISDAMDTMVEMFKSAAQSLKDFGLVARDTFGPNATRDFAKYVTLFVVLGGVMGPLLLAVVGLGWAFKGVLLSLAPIPAILKTIVAIFGWMATTTIPMLILQMRELKLAMDMVFILAQQRLGMAFAFLATPLGAVALVVAGLVTAFFMLKREGQSITDALMEMGQNIADTYYNVFNTIGAVISDVVLYPLRMFLKTVVALMELAGKEVPQSIRSWSEFATPKALNQLEASNIPVTKVSYQTFDERKKAGLMGEGGAKVVAQTPGAPDVMKELAASMGVGGMQKRFEEAMKAAAGSAASAEKAAKAAEKAATKKTQTHINIDGREVARATSKNQEELEARSGSQATPWQRTRPSFYGSFPR